MTFEQISALEETLKQATTLKNNIEKVEQTLNDVVDQRTEITSVKMNNSGLHPFNLCMTPEQFSAFMKETLELAIQERLTTLRVQLAQLPNPLEDKKEDLEVL